MKLFQNQGIEFNRSSRNFPPSCVTESLYLSCTSIRSPDVSYNYCCCGLLMALWVCDVFFFFFALPYSVQTWIRMVDGCFHNDWPRTWKHIIDGNSRVNVVKKHIPYNLMRVILCTEIRHGYGWTGYQEINTQLLYGRTYSVQGNLSKDKLTKTTRKW